MNISYRTTLWLLFFFVGFIFFLNFLGYMDDLTNVYQNQEGLHVPTFSNTPIPQGFIIFGVIEILIVILLAKNIISAKKNGTTVALDSTKGYTAVLHTPFFKAAGIFIVLGILFFGWLILALSKG